MKLTITIDTEANPNAQEEFECFLKSRDLLLALRQVMEQLTEDSYQEEQCITLLKNLGVYELVTGSDLK